MLLAGDIGGTKVNLAIYSTQDGLDAPLAETTLPSRRYQSLTDLVQVFLRHTSLTFDRAVFGVAGPVVGGRAEVTNLPWLLEEQDLAARLDVDRVHLLNDLEAIANAVPFLRSQDMHVLHPGRPVARAPIGIVAPGTGLGEAFLTWSGDRYDAHASEGGHATFGPVNEEQVDLLCFLMKRFSHVSYERVCSGIGIPNIYAFFKETGRYDEPEWLTEALAAADDDTPVIVQTALHRPDEAPICARTLDTFIQILGQETGNLALKVMATGGVYVGGGIPPRILSLLDDGPFLNAFLNKGRFRDLLEDVPVYVILNAKAALLGAASYGLFHM